MKKVNFHIVIEAQGMPMETVGVGTFRFSEEMIETVLSGKDPRERHQVASEIMRAAFDMVAKDLFEPEGEDQVLRTAEIMSRFVKILRKTQEGA